MCNTDAQGNTEESPNYRFPDEALRCFCRFLLGQVKAFQLRLEKTNPQQEGNADVECKIIYQINLQSSIAVSF